MRASAGGSTPIKREQSPLAPFGDTTDSIMVCIETCQVMKAGQELYGKSFFLFFDQTNLG